MLTVIVMSAKLCCGCVVGQPVKGCHNISSCGMSIELPANISASNVTATGPISVNSSFSDEPKKDHSVVSGSNIVLMLREESPAVAFDAEFHLFFIVDDGDIYLSRFDVDPTKDSGGTLRVNIKYKQYDLVSATLR